MIIDLIVVTSVLAGCAFFIGRSVKRTIAGGFAPTDCSCCGEKEECGKSKETT